MNVCWGYKKLYNQVRSDKPKTIDSDAVLLAIEENPMSSTRESSKQIQHLTIHSGLSPLQPQQKYQELSNGAEILPKYCNIFDSPKDIQDWSIKR